jgi:beta-1,4-N-acetylglucosaminyltransferase
LIFVTVGTNPTMHFDRLLKPMDELAALLDEQVILQTGCSAFVPQHAEHFAFTTSDHIETLNKSARIVISHAAAGSVITALSRRKPVIVVPRRHHLNEHIDDHQLELARALAEEKRAVVVYDPTVEALRQAIELVTEQGGTPSGAAPLMKALRQQLHGWRRDPQIEINSAQVNSTQVNSTQRKP